MKIFPEANILAILNFEEPNVIKRFKAENYSYDYKLEPSKKESITFDIKKDLGLDNVMFGYGGGLFMASG